MASGNRKKFSPCGHLGFGAYCHRCKAAEKLKHAAQLPANAKDKASMLAEAERLFRPKDWEAPKKVESIEASAAS